MPRRTPKWPLNDSITKRIGSYSVVAGAGGIGDVIKTAAFTTDHAVLRTDTATSSSNIQQSSVLIDDSDNVSGIGTLAAGATTLSGTLAMQANNITTTGLVDGVDLNLQMAFFHGTFLESFDATVTSNGTTITMALAKTGGGNLTCVFSDGSTGTAYTTHTAGNIALTAGSDSSPQTNWIYILQSDPTTLVKSTTSWPSGVDHIKVAFFFCQSAASVQAAGGPLINQNWNDHAEDTNAQGHLSHMGQKIRASGSTYFSGVDGNGTQGYLTPTAGNVELISTSGVIMQMHTQTYPAIDTSGTDEVHIKNWSGDAYHSLTNLYDIVADSGGNTIGNNKYFNLTVWGSVNKTGEHQSMLINLPSGFYNKQGDAQTDVSGFDDFTIPREFNVDSSTGFLIARITIQMKTGGGTWANITTTDLRGLTPQTAAGGASATVTAFADNVFDVFDNTDTTKHLAFDVGTSVTTGTTRTLVVPDVNGTIWTSGGGNAAGGDLDMNSFDINELDNINAGDTLMQLNGLDFGAGVGAGGAVLFVGGDGGGTSGNGGAGSLWGGNSTSGVGGAAQIKGGLSAAGGAGGAVTITGGIAQGAGLDGGDITLTGGTPGAGGTDGSIVFAGNSEDLALDFTANTATISTTTAVSSIALGTFDITGIDSLYIIEKAAGDADVVGSGQIWVKNDAPNTLWFTDDAGGDHQLPSGSVGAVTFGSENEIPSTNAGTNDFDYSGNFKYDGTDLTLTGGDIFFDASTTILRGSSPSSSTFTLANNVGANGRKTRLIFSVNAVGSSHSAIECERVDFSNGKLYLQSMQAGALNTVITLDESGVTTVAGELDLDGDFNHDGTNFGAFSVAPVNRPGATEDIKDLLTTLGFMQGTSASPLDLDGGQATVGLLVGEGGRIFDRTTGGNVTVTTAMHYIGITDSGSFARTVTLPASHTAGQCYVVKDEQDASLNTITIATADADTIDGAASVTITTQYGKVRVISDGTNWWTW